MLLLRWLLCMEEEWVSVIRVCVCLLEVGFIRL